MAVVLMCCVPGAATSAQTIEQMREDQVSKLQRYVLDAIQPSGLVRDSLVLSPNQQSFHPATPDAAGFALVALAAFDHLGTLPLAESQVLQILRAYSGETPGVTPERSPDGHWIHFMDIATGADPPGWDDSYSPIGSALLAAGAQFARNHFVQAGSPFANQIDALTENLVESIDFNAAIHPSLDGRIYLDMTSSGGGAGGAVRPWNEYQLVVSLALQQEQNDRAIAVKHLWLNADNAPTRSGAGLPTLTDDTSRFAPAFWGQQANYFNGDFRFDADFQQLLRNHQQADQLYSRVILDAEVGYGLTAGVSPSGYHADRMLNHPDDVLSPEAVAAWGDLETLLDIYQQQIDSSDPRQRYGLHRYSLAHPNWVPGDAGLVDHLFLLFGIVDAFDPDFFDARVMPGLLDGDYDLDGELTPSDYTAWRDNLAGERSLVVDGNLDGQVDHLDWDVWRHSYAELPSGQLTASRVVPEPAGWWLAFGVTGILAGRWRMESC